MNSFNINGRKLMPCRQCENCLQANCRLCRTCLNKKLAKKCEMKGDCLRPKLSKIKISKCWHLEEVGNNKVYPLQNPVEEFSLVVCMYKGFFFDLSPQCW